MSDFDNDASGSMREIHRGRNVALKISLRHAEAQERTAEAQERIAAAQERIADALEKAIETTTFDEIASNLDEVRDAIKGLSVDFERTIHHLVDQVHHAGDAIASELRRK